jgi:hypothetical protein
MAAAIVQLGLDIYIDRMAGIDHKIADMLVAEEDYTDRSMAD